MKHPVSALLAIPLLFSGAHFVAKLARAWILTTPVHTLATFRCGRTKRGGAPILVLLLAASLPSSVRGFESNANAEAGESTNSVEKPILAEDRQHWAFQPLDRPPLPAVVDRTWPRNAIDQFILAKIEAAGMSPLPSADRFTLIRRLTFDLTGLPPTPRAIAEFISDQSPDAYDRLVERLLASPEYGVRWGQHWLDLARFAETDGFEHDHVRPDAWRYRDWVIDALNLDLPLDEFLRMQLAGDELQPDELSAAIPTGFLLCGPDMPDINRQDERRHTFLNEMTATVSSVMLGLQMGCAQCHDHKYDPISQLDFYRLRAFFEHDDLFKKHPVPTTEQRAVQRQFQAKRQTPPPMPMGRVMREPDAVVKPSHLRIRGDFQRIGPRVFPEFPRIVNATDSKVPQPKPNAVSSGRRTALAAWLTQPDHRLTTRVLVNRIWQFHFGQGLCRSPSDFGLMGEAPTHPQLLDWLATELPRQGWSLKRMHRLLLTSATYRQASRPTSRDWTPQQTAAARESWQLAKRQDPDNELLARMPRHRLEGEAIRDAILAAADDLNQRRGGPGIRPPLPKELLVTLLKNQWPVTADVQDHHRRSTYLFVRRNLRFPIFEVFDKPDTNASCPRRNRSTIAPQALMLLNSELSLSAARAFAAYIFLNAEPNPRARINLCYLRALGREPTDVERNLAATFLADDAARLQQAVRANDEIVAAPLKASHVNRFEFAAMTDLCLSLFNLNEFIYID